MLSQANPCSRITSKPAVVTAAQVGKKKVLEAVFPDLKTAEGGIAAYKGIAFTIAGKGNVTAPVPAGYSIM